MKKNCVITGLALAINISAHAALTEPPNIFYGRVTVDSQALTAADSGYSVVLKLNNVVLDSYSMGSSSSAADNYVIRVPVDTLGQQSQDVAREGDQIDFYLTTPSGSEQWLASDYVGRRGLIRPLQLGTVNTAPNSVEESPGGCFDQTSSDTCVTGTSIQSASSDGRSTALAAAQPQFASMTAGGKSTVVLAPTATSEADLMSAAEFSAWVGNEYSVLSLPESVYGYEFYRSREADCDWASYTSCDNGQMDIVGSSAIKDSAATLKNLAYYFLQNNATSTSVMTLDAREGSPVLPPKTEQVISFNGKLWLFARGPQNQAQVWSSADGISWREMDLATPFPGMKEGYAVAVFSQRIWIIGGKTEDGNFSKAIWSSEDGLHWQEESSHAGFSARAHHQLLSYQGQLWLFGGRDELGRKAEVWTSRDGVNWEQIETRSMPADREGFQVIPFKDRFWLVGGEKNGTFYSDVWSSTDAREWVQVSLADAFASRAGHRLVTFNDRLLLLGGRDSDTYFDDIWFSEDGLNWRSSDAAFSAREQHHAVQLNGQLFILGGNDGKPIHDVWSSNDGFKWQRGTKLYAIYR
ncbi:hypothetical protein FKG94_08685 [Exilibacterium tricleocarpae]|uniref:Uncharacterized protein n=2 Tax=Exilibacterium tricleocarpae TaxID=2591008 RepID=A0A545TVD9_9GAMM|nr:hypothetical protein FKG94_08685 [Exilibacterium tricleocarpae]